VSGGNTNANTPNSFFSISKNAAMSYLVIARKYRPKNFSEIVGQEHITQTLINAINDNRVAHAYLFSGPRGVGKTTTARVLSKSLNCEQGPTIDPCNTCSNCREIDDSINLDVLEIDGASNRGIEEIRTLQENTRYAPGRGKHKIYIIDEVHMLTKPAFNALLKTLEEPPKHVIFIFATTEPHKVPMTVLSRCQRFNFRRLLVPEIEERIKNIASKEKIDIDDAATRLIARQADGSLRDGESMLDQLFTFAEEKITVDEVRKVYGFVEEELYYALTDAIHEKNENAILTVIDTVFDRGYDMEEFVSGYLKHLRKLFLLKHDVELSDLSPAEREYYNERKNHFTGFLILQMMNRLSQLMQKMKNSAITRILLEIELLILARMGDVVEIRELIRQIEGIKARDPLVAEEEKEPYAIPENPEIPDHDGNKTIETIWSNVIKRVEKEKRPLAGILYNANPIGLEDNELKVKIQETNSFFHEQIEQNGGREFIEEILSAETGKRTKVTFIEEKEKAKPKKEQKKSRTGLRNHEMVKKAQKILKAKIPEEG
jgi:DNA polymerase-3 subunit gamma/tau